MSARLLSEHLKDVRVMELKICDVYMGQAQRGGSEDPLRYLRQSHLDRKHMHTHIKKAKKKKKAKRQSRDMGHGNKRPPAPSFEKWKWPRLWTLSVFSRTLISWGFLSHPWAFRQKSVWSEWTEKWRVRHSGRDTRGHVHIHSRWETTVGVGPGARDGGATEREGNSNSQSSGWAGALVRESGESSWVGAVLGEADPFLAPQGRQHHPTSGTRAGIKRQVSQGARRTARWL